MSEHPTDTVAAPAAETHCRVSRAQLPLHCPTDQMSLWNSHPRVYLPIEESGEATCPYCGAVYTLSEQGES